MIPGVVEAGGGKVLASTSDDFNRANSTDITAAGKKWTETSGDWSITSNQLTTATAAASYPIATLRTNTKNATVKVDRANGDGWGVAFWVVDQNNWFAANTEMTQSSAQNPGSSGSYVQSVYDGNTCSGKSYNGDASWPAYGGTCYDVVCTAPTGGTPATYDYRTPSGLYCTQDGVHCGGGWVVWGYTAGDEGICGGTCCCSPVMVDPGTPPTGCDAYQIQNCCIYLDATDSGCPGSCNGQSPRPQYHNETVYYSNPETRTWTYSQKAIIRKSVAGTVSVVANTAAVTSTETVGAAVAASSPTRPTSLTVTLVGEGITISAPGAAGGTITGSHTATGANRGKKHGVSIAPATVVQSNAVDNFVYTKP
jgi:hypothetical protein